MKLENFLRAFTQVVDNPGALPHLRRLILDLAVQGRLVAQDDKDEPAEGLLKRIKDEKTRLLKSGEIKTQEQLPPVRKDAVPFPLPNGWTVSQLSDVAVCLDYMREPVNSTERALRTSGKKQGELFPYYGATQQQGWIDNFIFNAELVLLGEDGVPFFDALRPKAYLISGKTWVNNHAHVFRGILVSNTFLMHCLNVFDFTGRVAGSTRSKLNKAKALDIPIALPPLAEQKRIVAKVAELMALCDRLEAQLEERDVKQAALAKAALAKFTEDPTPENLQLLFHPLFSIPTEDLQGVVRSLAAGGKLVASTSSWNKEKLGDLCIKIGSGSTPTGGKEAYHKSGTPLIRSMNVHFDGIHDEGLAFLNDSQAEKLKNVTVAGGDVLLNITGASIGRVTVAPERIAGARVNQHVCIIRTLTKLTPRFLALVLASPEIQGVINNVQVGATREALNKSMIQDFDIPMPSIEEQNLTSDKASALLDACKLLEAQIEASRTTGEKLLEAMVAELTSA